MILICDECDSVWKNLDQVRQIDQFVGQVPSFPTCPSCFDSLLANEGHFATNAEVSGAGLSVEKNHQLFWELAQQEDSEETS